MRVEADTTGGAIRQAQKLGTKLVRFLSHEDAWFDDVLIAVMIEPAGGTGDVVRNPIELKEMSFDQRNSWTAHYGGVYLFQDADHLALVTCGDKKVLEGLAIRYMFDLTEHNRIAKFLELNDLVELIVKARSVDAGAIMPGPCRTNFTPSQRL
ncbi:hypothetical protein ROG8370_02240 [Roseovarius gaetbuli]|uniref:Uncharacterized protein n=1 Tax=Roseovarius gaetbuli TaxID=1356575 RepID=A0A1X6ZGU7_9RHOB|nr:hypothetical protein ROG8370_02240 [Roseovarius gaetbuli]